MNDIDREIDLKDLCKFILYKWRTILLCLCIGIVIASVAILVSRINQLEAVTTILDVQVDEDTIRERLNGFDDINIEQQTKINEAVRLYGRFQVYRQYADEIDAIYNNDYINTPDEALQFIVKLNSTSNTAYDISGILGQELYNYISDGGFSYDIAESGATELSSELLSELISIRYDNLTTDYYTQINGQNNASIDIARINQLKNATISYTIVCKSTKDVPASAIAELLLSQIDTLEKKYSNLGNYEIELVNRYNLKKYGPNEAEKIYAAHETENSTLKQLQDYIKTLSTEEKAIFNRIMGLSEENSFSLKYAFLIVVCIPLLYVMYLIFLYVLSDTIKTSDEFEAYYNVKLLGELKEIVEKKGFGTKVDKLLDKIFLKKQVNAAKRDELLVATIQAICRQNETKSIHFVSVLDYDSISDSFQRVVDILKDDGFSIKVESDITNSCDFIANTDSKQVIFVEKLGQCTNKDFMKGYSICKNNNSTVLGVVVF